MKIKVSIPVPLPGLIILSTLLLCGATSALAQPTNDNCSGATTLTSDVTCSNTNGTLLNSNKTSGSISAGCGNNNSCDVWYKFTPSTAYPVITLSSIGSSFNSAGPRIALYQTSDCSNFTYLGCSSSLTFDVRTVIGGSGLSVGSPNEYYIRVFSNGSTSHPTSGTWTFKICITDPSPGTVDYSKSYINVTNLNGGGTIDPGDILEIRATLAIQAGAVDSIAFYDTVFRKKGFILNNISGGDSICLRTNEGTRYKAFTDAADADAGWRSQTPALDTAIQINIGLNASKTVRGKLRNTSRPSFYSSSCIIMATYRVRVDTTYGTHIKYGGGEITYRDSATGVYHSIYFPPDSLIVYSSPGLCPNSVSATNAVGVETNGTFGTASGSPPLARNRAASGYVPSYTIQRFQTGSPQGPQDYYYGIANNTSTTFTTSQIIAKPDGGSPQKRLCGLWDIIGDHTGATNTARGNPPCDTTKAVSATNPCGYMLLINSSYNTDTAFQYTVSSLCPNTYYELSAWIRNVCKYCSCDSAGNGATSATYLHYNGADSSGVHPNLAFNIDGLDYYNTGDIFYYGGGTGTGSDTVNIWNKRGFVFKTGSSQTSFTLTIRNNAPGGGGNDWALDDITVATCYPNMNYSKINNPGICENNSIMISDTVRSYFSNFTEWKWQRSTDGGSTWSDIPGASGSSSGTWNGTYYEYIASYTIPPAYTTAAHNGDKYRLVVATTSSNLAGSCGYTDPTPATLTVLTNCNPLKTDLLSITGRLNTDKATISWVTSREEEPVTYTLERSDDGNNFSAIAVLNGYNNIRSETNIYSYADPNPLTRKTYYRVVLVPASGSRKYSRMIELTPNAGSITGFGSVINPFYNELQYELVLPSVSVVRIDLVDGYGKTVRSQTQRLSQGVNSLSIFNTNDLAPGLYILKAEINGALFTRKVIKGNK